MPSLPLLSVLLLLLPSALLLNPVEADDHQGVGTVQDGRIEKQIERPPSPSSNALFAPLPERLSNEDRQARKLLRKKKKRLRELREEIRRMGGAKGANGVRTAQFERSRDVRWRRRMLARLDTITRRLDHLETLIVESKASSREPEKTKAEKKMDRHFASISRSLNGEVGMACGSHRDCRPGRCCHAAAADRDASATCVRHDASAADACSDSCQCMAQLHCFAPADNTTKPVCKRATSADIVLGTYLNNPNAIF